MSKKFSLDTNITRIRAIVEEMQKGITDFDKQVALFKEAAALIKECQAYLHTAELEVEQLVNDAWKPLEQ
jgi:exodeoxyribonuclease VII small subunit